MSNVERVIAWFVVVAIGGCIIGVYKHAEFERQQLEERILQLEVDRDYSLKASMEVIDQMQEYMRKQKAEQKIRDENEQIMREYTMRQIERLLSAKKRN
jgi:hypothetical protein